MSTDNEHRTLTINSYYPRLMTLVLSSTLIMTLSNIPLVAESQDMSTKKSTEPVNESFLTYNGTIYGTSIDYPSNWEIYDDSEFLLSILENISSSEQEGINQNNEIASKVFDILKSFGLNEVSDVLGLKPDVRSEFFQKMSQALTEGTIQMIVAIASPPEDESDIVAENMNIAVENISHLSPISLNDYVNANIEGMKISIPGFSMIEPVKEITVDGKPAISFVFTDGSVEQPGTALQVYTIRDDMAYILNFGASAETYSVYAPTFERMLKSFKINN